MWVYRDYTHSNHHNLFVEWICHLANIMRQNLTGLTFAAAAAQHRKSLQWGGGVQLVRDCHRTSVNLRVWLLAPFSFLLLSFSESSPLWVRLSSVRVWGTSSYSKASPPLSATLLFKTTRKKILSLTSSTFLDPTSPQSISCEESLSLCCSPFFRSLVPVDDPVPQ